MADQGFHIVSRLRRLTTEIRQLEHDLKSEPASDPATMHDFRQAVDEIRLTAWTVSELHNAKAEQKDVMVSFLAAERIRRFAQMIRDLSVDLEHQDIRWETGGIQSLFDSVSALRARLERLIREHRANFRNLKDEKG